MAGDALELRLNADVSSLAVQLALAQQNMRDTNAEVKTLAKQFVDASADMKASLAPELEKATHAAIEAKASIASLGAEMKKASEEGAASLGSHMKGLSESVEAANAKLATVTGLVSKLSEFALVGLGIDRAAEAINNVAETGEQLLKLSDVTGISVSELSALRVIAVQTGTDFDAFSGDLTKFARAISESLLNPTGKAADAFNAMGIAVKDSAGNVRPMSDLLQELAGKLSSYEGGANKAALESAVFGRSGTDLDAMLKNLAEEGMQGAIDQSTALGQNWTNEQAKAARDYEENLKTLKLALEGIETTILKGVIPSLSALANEYRALFDPTPIEAAQAALKDLQGRALVLKGIVEHPWVGMLRGMSAGSAADELEKTGELIKAKQAEIDKMQHPDGAGAPPPPAAAPPLTKPDKELTGMAALEDQLHRQLLAKGEYDKTAQADEIDFWEKQNATAVAGSAEAAAIVGKLYALKDEQFKQGEEKAKTASTAEVGIWDAALVKRLSAEGIFGDNAKVAELAFWQQKEAAATAGSAQYNEIVKKVYALQSELDAKRIESAKKTASEEVDAEERSAAAKVTALQGQASLLQGEVELGTISAAEKLASEISIEEQIYQIELAAADKKAELYSNDAEKFKQAQLEKEKLEAQHAARVAALNQQAAILTQQAWQKAFAPISAAFDASINGVIQGTEHLKQAEQKAAQSILLSFLDTEEKKLQAAVVSDLQILASKIRTEFAITSATVAGGSAQVAAKTATTAQSQSIGMIAGAKEIASKAYEAAAGAYNAVVGIPYIGPVLAPVAAATAYAGVMAFDVISAEGGMGNVPGDDMPALLHRNEMVLPASIANPLRESLSGGGGTGDAMGTGGDVHFHGPLMSASMSAHGIGADEHAHSVMKIFNDHIQAQNFKRYPALARAFRR